MADFSAGEAIASGFRLIGRRPSAILWWAGAYLVFGVAPLALTFLAIGPDLLAFYQHLARDALAGSRTPDMSGLLALQSRIAVLQPVSLLSSLVTQSLLLGAIYRGVLHPEDARFGYLRFSLREVWLGVVMAVLYIVICVAIGIAVGIAGVIAVLGARGAGVGAGGVGLVIAALVLIAIAVVVWLVARFCLALPLSFDRRTFAVGESWELTAGHAPKIILVGLTVFVILLVVEMVVLGLGLALVIGAVGEQVSRGAWMAASPASLMRALLPWIGVWFGLHAVVLAPLYAIVAAPVADIYRQLTPGEQAA